MGIGETYQFRAAAPRYRRHSLTESYFTAAGASMPVGHKNVLFKILLLLANCLINGQSKRVRRMITGHCYYHYAQSVKMNGPGTYTVKLKYSAPDEKGFLHHTDEETGTPDWFKPFVETFTFSYPQK